MALVGKGSSTGENQKLCSMKKERQYYAAALSHKRLQSADHLFWQPGDDLREDDHKDEREHNHGDERQDTTDDVAGIYAPFRLCDRLEEEDGVRERRAEE